MEVFNFPYHRLRTAYPDDQSRVRFGAGFVFTAAPVFPLQRTFVLSMTGIQWFVDSNDAPEATTEPDRNAKVLDDFYRAHRLHTPFYYNHYSDGQIIVRFNKPLELPIPDIGSNGVLPEFDIELIEHKA